MCLSVLGLLKYEMRGFLDPEDLQVQLQLTTTGSSQQKSKRFHRESSR